MKKPDIERDLAAGQAILSCYRIEPQDVFIILSNSGVNAAIVEVAQRVKEHGHSLVALTSLEHTQRMVSRHPSGKKLYEFADIVIDNCGPFGDALLELPDGGKACSVSSLGGVLINQMLTAETIGQLIARGIDPPFTSRPTCQAALSKGKGCAAAMRGASISDGGIIRLCILVGEGGRDQFTASARPFMASPNATSTNRSEETGLCKSLVVERRWWGKEVGTSYAL